MVRNTQNIRTIVMIEMYVCIMTTNNISSCPESQVMSGLGKKVDGVKTISITFELLHRLACNHLASILSGWNKYACISPRKQFNCIWARTITAERFPPIEHG